MFMLLSTTFMSLISASHWALRRSEPCLWSSSHHLCLRPPRLTPKPCFILLLKLHMTLHSSRACAMREAAWNAWYLVCRERVGICRDMKMKLGHCENKKTFQISAIVTIFHTLKFSHWLVYKLFITLEPKSTKLQKHKPIRALDIK